MDGQDTNWTSSTAGTVTDKSVSGNNGTLGSMSQSTSPIAGVIGQGLKFDGVNDYVHIGDKLDPLTNISISAWFNERVGVANNTLKSIVVKSDHNAVASADAYSLNFKGAANTLRYSVSNGTSFGNCDTTFDRNSKQGTWHHVVGVYNGASVTAYIDNVQSPCNISLTGSVLNNSKFLAIGSDSNEGNYFFDGSIDEVRVYNRALSASEAAELYNAGAKKLIKINNPDTSRLTSGLVGYWTMDGQDTNWTSATDGTVTDKSGQGSTGTFTNMKQSLSPVPGIVGQGVKIWQGSPGGTSDNEKITLGSPNALDNLGSSTPITISTWIYSKSNPGHNTWRGIYSVFHSGTPSDFIINPSNSLQYNRVYSGTDIARKTNNNVIANNQWQHVLATWSGDVSGTSASNIHIYVNGVEQGYQTTTDGTGNYTTDAAQVKDIGNCDSGDCAFQGYIDEFRLYNRVLSASEIQELYKAGR
jgi:hypothetical protein